MEKQEQERRYKGHVVIIPYPSQGHINPALEFGKRLVSKELKVTLATTIYISKSNKSEVEPVGCVQIGSFSDGCDEGGFAEAGSVTEYLKRLETVGSKTLRELIQELGQSDGQPVNCLVYDAFLVWALDVARGLGITAAAFFTQSCSVCAIYYHAYHGNLTVPLEATTTLPALPPLEIAAAPSFMSAVGSYPAYFALVSNQFSNVDEADWVLFNTFDQLEVPIVKWMQGLWPIKTIGPTLPSIYLDKRVEGDVNYSINLHKLCNDIRYKEWLDKKPIGSVIYVAFGSMAELGEESREELACGLKASNKYFLWVLKESERNKLPTNFINDAEDRGLLVTWCLQLEVLAHDAVGCFATHCGWNSTLEALSLGVPMLCMPQWTDQPTNAKLIEDVWCVGVRARADEKGIVRSEEIEKCIKQVMDGEKSEELKRNARKWKKLAREAVDEGGSSDTNIQTFVDSLVMTNA